MNDVQLLPCRIRAFALGHAVPTRAASSLASDGSVTIAVATIKIVTEEHVQALAYGDPEGIPNVLGRIDPLGRDASDLEPFAHWLVGRFEDARRIDVLPRLWLPTQQTLETLDVLGHRYERNASAPDVLRMMGTICRIVAREHRHAGQQMVAVASTLLQTHVATGQSPAEDAHLGALLAWIDPPAGVSAAEMAARRAIEPAGGVLANHPARPDDDRVEVLRRQWKRSSGTSRSGFGTQIQGILERAALDEWELLVEARNAFRALPLAWDGLHGCVDASRERVFRAIDEGAAFVPKNPLPRIREMMALEHSQDLMVDANLMTDSVVRSDARRRGRVISGTIAAVEQLKPGRKPCIVVLETTQRDLRFRRDERVKTVGVGLTGRILGIDYDQTTGRGSVRLQIQDGVMKWRSVLRMGVDLEWIRDGGFSMFMKSKTIAGLETPWCLAAEGIAPAVRPFTGLSTDLLAMAHRHLGGRS